MSKKDFAAALETLGRPIVFYPSIANVLGIKETLFVCQLVYWMPRATNDRGEGWVFKSAEEWEEETGLTYKEQIRVREVLREQGILEEESKRSEHRIYFRVNFEALNLVLEPDKKSDGHMTKSQMAPDERSDGTLPKVSSYKETEITTESTAEITRHSSNSGFALFRKVFSRKVKVSVQRNKFVVAQYEKAVGELGEDELQRRVVAWAESVGDRYKAKDQKKYAVRNFFDEVEDFEVEDEEAVVPVREKSRYPKL